MSTEDNKALVRRFYDEVINKKNLAAIDEFVDPHVIDHALPPGMPGGIEGMKQVNALYFDAFPDTHFRVEDTIAEGEVVVARLTISATQQGAFLGLPPTGKHVTVTGITIIRCANSKIVEHWNETDMLGLWQQLAVVPSPEQAGS